MANARSGRQGLGARRRLGSGAWDRLDARGRLGTWGRQAVQAVLLLFAGACATGQDVADVRAELRVLAARQDSAFRALTAAVVRGDQRAMDSLAALTGEIFAFRGDVNGRLVAIREQQLRMGELAGQSQRSLESLRQDVSAQRREMARQQAAREAAEAEAGDETGDSIAADAQADAEPEAPPAPDPEIGRQNYEALVQHLDRGNFVIAKQGFAGFVEEFPNHEFTPAAYLHLGELSAQDDLLDEAVAYYLRIPELFPASDAVPNALYRAGALFLEMDDCGQTREHWGRLVESYGEHRLADRARERLQECP